MEKKSLSERDVCTKFITPALEAAGWNRSNQFLEEVNLTSGRIVVRGNKAKRDEKPSAARETQSRVAGALVESALS